MYQRFYQLSDAPFRMTPDPGFLYLSPGHQEALAALFYGVEQRKGFIVLLGEVGLGKTTILRSYLARVDAGRVTTAYVFNANVTFKVLLETILRELGIEDVPADVYGMVNRLHTALIEEHRQGRTVVVIVDEAHNMPIETLEELRVLSNLETATDKLVQIVLAGQPELAERLERRELRQLKQRIAVRCALSPLTATQSLAYIEYRLNNAGSRSRILFTNSALRRIVKHADGIPRVLNVLCDNALVTGLGRHEKPVTARVVRETVRDLRLETRVSPRGWAWTSVAVALGLSVLFTVPDRMRQPSSPEIVATPAGARLTAAQMPAASEHDLAASRFQGADDRVATQTFELPPRAEEAPLVTTRVVEEGENLSHMALDVYGFSTASVLDRVVRDNPWIVDMNTILVGTSVRFPDVSDLRPERSLTREGR